MRVLNWAYVEASNSGPDDPMRSFDFDVVRAVARNMVEDRANEALKKVPAIEHNTEEMHAVVTACTLARFWANGFFNRSIVDAFTAREVFLALQAFEVIANGLPDGGPSHKE